MDYGVSCHHNKSLCSNYLMSVDLNGDLRPVCDAFVGLATTISPELVVANIDNVKGYDDFINHTKMNDFQEKFYRKRMECKECSVYKYCHGGCSLFKSRDNKLSEFSEESAYCSCTKAYLGLIDDEYWRKIIVESYR
ncbi:MAG: SPASM domain-containing protein [Oligoflexia bacterium]|nr:SPASM domain-containing protein [Oligoflexia bacterium]